MGATKKTGTRSRTAGKAPARKASKASSSKTAKPKKSTSGTRTSSRSAKRRSPKTPPPDAGLLEVERLEFLKAMDKYKRKTGKTFPSWTEVLDVLRSIGWVSQVRMDEQHRQPS
ncbi:MAG: hypothetical protein ACYTCU_08165 [Planctomycetota bacterium]|jgi:hypothetical protein